jgi:hypothetical protein
MDPINKNPLFVSINIPAPWIRHGIGRRFLKTSGPDMYPTWAFCWRHGIANGMTGDIWWLYHVGYVKQIGLFPKSIIIKLTKAADHVVIRLPWCWDYFRIVDWFIIKNKKKASNLDDYWFIMSLFWGSPEPFSTRAHKYIKIVTGVGIKSHWSYPKSYPLHIATISRLSPRLKNRHGEDIHPNLQIFNSLIE